MARSTKAARKRSSARPRVEADDATSAAEDATPAAVVAELAPDDEAASDDEEVSLADLMISDADDVESGEVEPDDVESGDVESGEDGFDEEEAIPSEPVAEDDGAQDDGAQDDGAQDDGAQAGDAEEPDALAADVASSDSADDVEVVADDGEASGAEWTSDESPADEASAAGEPTGSDDMADDAAEDEQVAAAEAAADAADRAAEHADAEDSSLDAGSDESAASLDDDEATREPPAAAERQTVPESVEAKRLDAPLPSFEMPEADGSPAPAPAPVPPPRSETPTAFPSPPALNLSEVAEEEDDDAVTHIGVPLPESDEFPEDESSYAGAEAEPEPPLPEPEDAYAESDPPAAFPEIPQGDFEVGEAGLAAFDRLDPEAALAEARRASTVIVPRMDPSALRGGEASGSDTAPAAVASAPATGPRLFSRLFAGGNVLERSAWSRRFMDRYLPPISLVLLGAGLGSVGILLLKERPREDVALRTQAVQSLKQAPVAPKPKPKTLLERAQAGDGEALYKLTTKSPAQRTAQMVLALEQGKRAQKRRELDQFAKQVKAPSDDGPVNLLDRFMEYATGPETMIPAFEELLTWEGPLGPDLLYGVWEGAPVGSRAAALAPELLFSSDLRAKATPALSVALDLQQAKTCDDYARVLPRVVEHGDQRCGPTMRSLKHTDGCGDDGNADCYACLREGTVLDDALAAIEERPAPKL